MSGGGHREHRRSVRARRTWRSGAPRCRRTRPRRRSRPEPGARPLQRRPL